MDALLARGSSVIVLTRAANRMPTEWKACAVRLLEVDLLDSAAVRGTCRDTDVVFHLASHRETGSKDVDGRHRALSVCGTRALLEEAERSGVRRFVYVSSVKAAGEVTIRCVDETVEPRPVSEYGKAKLVAESLVHEAGARGRVGTCSVRLPMVYGPNPAGSVMRMMAAIDRGWFPSLPEVGNQRSMVHVDDVVQALLLAADSAVAVGQTYLVTDDQVYSTRKIYEAICHAVGRPVPTFKVPIWVISLAAFVGEIVGSVTGRNVPINRSMLDKLLGSACYSSKKIQRELGYRPTHTLYSALPAMVVAYRAGIMNERADVKRRVSDPTSR